MRRPALLLLPLALLLTAAASRANAASRPNTASRPNIPTLGEVVEVSIVNMDVFVTDKHGKRVRGLTKDDFVVTEDRKIQPISNFEEYAANVANAHASVEGVAAPEAPVAQAPPTQKRTVIFFVDRFLLTGLDRDKFFGGMKDLLHKTVREGDSAMIVTWRKSLQVREPFTDDLERLDGTIDQLAKEAGIPFANEYVQNANEQSDYDAWSKEVQAMAASHQATSSLGGNRPGLELSFLQALFELKQKAAAINALSASISGVEGKKVMFLALHRMGEYAGAEYLYAGGGNPATDVEYRSRYGTKDIITSITKNANANGITVYPLYPEGLTSLAMTRADLNQSPDAGYDYLVLNNETPSLELIAKETGGLMAWGAQNIVEMLPAVQDDFDSYYSLAYRATTTNQDRARAIVVKTKNSEYVVRARRQFVEKSDDARMKDRVIANLFQSPGPSRIGVEVRFGQPTQKKKDQFSIPVSVKIPIASLTTVPQLGKNAGAFSVYMSWGSQIGVTGEVVRKTQAFTIDPREAAKANAGSFTYDLELLVDSRTSQLSIGVFDEVSREYGLARVDLPERVKKVAEARDLNGSWRRNRHEH
jgi:VWFA-related protein